MELSLEQRKQLYIEKIREEYIPVKVKWWEPEKPLYHSTKEFALGYSGIINTAEPMVFKKLKKETLIWAVMLACISVLLYFVTKTFSFFHIVVIALFFVVFLPKLVNPMYKIRVSRNGIWAYNSKQEITWQNVMLSYIKEVKGNEASTYTLIIHYYDPKIDEFRNIESSLYDVFPKEFSAAIEAFREKAQPS